MVKRVLLAALFSACVVIFAMPQIAGAVSPAATLPDQTNVLGLVQKADIYKTCQQIHWCGTRRDGTPYCGPTLRCRTCNFVRKCTRALGCVWQEKCRWGPFQPVIRQ